MYLRVILDVPLAVQTQAQTGSVDSGSPAKPVQPDGFDYRWSGAARPGLRVIVPWGRQTVIGLISAISEHTDVDATRLRDAVAVLDDVDALSPQWFALMRFAASYYQRSLGEVALPALPTLLRKSAAYRESEGLWTSRSVSAMVKRVARPHAERGAAKAECATTVPVLTAQQTEVTQKLYAALASGEGTGRFAPILLHGITGSGKTEVYLRAIAEVIARGKQALVLVPEINLTPQLEQTFRNRFPAAAIATLHSGMADGARATHWLMAHAGRADILLGTRMAVLASLPDLGLIVVDEEHDPSFKQQEGLRYSARDMAVVRAQQLEIPVILGSATPSLESWWQADRGRYQKLVLTERAVQSAVLPAIQLIGLQRQKLEHGFSETLRLAIAQRLERGEQSLVFLNRRGYAPVVACGACGWISNCKRCSAHAVFHKSDGRLHCHHCGWETRVPRACPDCGNVDLAPLGRGTQRVEEALTEWFPAARIARIDRDSTRKKGSAQALFDAVHAGAIDILVGTQMVAKGHDFQNLTLVGVVDADSALFSHDFRAAERLFANLMQVGGRAGRAGKPGEVLIQTRYPEHPLFAALVRHDFPRFATSQIEERRRATLPPFSYQAILRAEGRTVEAALAFLHTARAAAETLGERGVTLYDAVPMNLVRLANVERAQLLVESGSRRALQDFLPRWIAALSALPPARPRVQWGLEVDPLDI